jgi:hypothetical protein
LVFPNEAIVPESLEGRLATPYFSVTIMNANVTEQIMHTSTGSFLATDETASSGKDSEQGWVQVLDVRARADDGKEVSDP